MYFSSTNYFAIPNRVLIPLVKSKYLGLINKIVRTKKVIKMLGSVSNLTYSKRNLESTEYWKNYFSRRKYVLLLSSRRYPANLFNDVIVKAKTYDLSPKVIKNGILKRLLSPEVQFSGSTLVLTSDSLESALDFVRRHVITSKGFYVQGDVIEQDFTLKPFVTGLKAGSSIALFQNLVKVKVNRGFLELVDPLIIKKSDKVSESLSKALLLLQLKLKPQALQIYGVLQNKRTLSKSLTNFMLTEGLVELNNLKEVLAAFSKCWLPIGFEASLKKVSNLIRAFDDHFESYLTE